VSTTVALLPLALYNLGLAFGPIVGAPLSETFGRKVVYQSTTPIFALFLVGSGFARGIVSLTICRFFAGLFGSPGISFAAATISDMVPLLERAPYMAVYYSMPWLGSALAPLIGSYAITGKGWRWTQWVALFFTAASISSTCALKESFKKQILKNRAKELQIQGPVPENRTSRQELQHFATTTIERPLHMLFTEPAVLSLCLYASFDFGLLYIFVVASPETYSKVYGFDLNQQGLSFGGFIIGSCMAALPVILVDRYLYQRNGSKTPNRDGPRTSLPERRLHAAMFGSLLLPAGLFWYGWSMHSGVHWACPMAAQGVAILGAMDVYIAANLYLMDIYGAKFGASAQAANSFARYTLSAGTPLFALQMYQGLGIAWASSVLGFCALALAPIPWVLYHFGNRIRAKSRYPAGD